MRDNYQVLCSLTPPDPVTSQFPADAVVYSSMVYTAWKRIYVDDAIMYKKGSFVKDYQGENKIILVQDNRDFVNGGNVRVEYGDKYIQFNIIIKEGTDTFVYNTVSIGGTFGRLPEEYDIVRDPIFHTETTELISWATENNSFGLNFCRTNEITRTFVDFLIANLTPIKIPKVIEGINWYVDLYYSGLHHATNSYIGQNRIFLAGVLNNSFDGWHSIGLPTGYYIEHQAFVNLNVGNSIDIAYHEFAHSFGLKKNDNDHIDNNNSTTDHTCGSNSDKCLLSYLRNRSDSFRYIDGLSELDGCAYLIRKAMDRL